MCAIHRSWLIGSAGPIALLALALSGCDDPPFPAVPEARPLADKGSTAGDRRCWTVGAEGSGWNCSQIGECARGCGTNLDCIVACKSKGCPTGKEAFEKTSACVQAKCLGSCLGGFSEACWACAQKSCPADTAACEQQFCGGGTPVAVCAEMGSSPPPPPDGPSGGSENCATMRQCASACLLTSCVAACRQEGCPAGLAALNDLFNCARAKCSLQCGSLFDYPLLGSLLCKPCVEMSCLPEISACDAQKC